MLELVFVRWSYSSQMFQQHRQGFHGQNLQNSHMHVMKIHRFPTRIHLNLKAKKMKTKLMYLLFFFSLNSTVMSCFSQDKLYFSSLSLISHWTVTRGKFELFLQSKKPGVVLMSMSGRRHMSITKLALWDIVYDASSAFLKEHVYSPKKKRNKIRMTFSFFE